MRIIAGSHRRRRLHSVSGMTVRPASDRLRQAVFNILADRVEDARVADLFAGIGSLGLEALSRGAATVDFVERDRRVFGALSKNVIELGFADRARRRRAGVFGWVKSRPAEPLWDLAFVDPPYGLYRQERPHSRLVRLFEQVGERLAEGGTAIVSAPTDEPTPQPPANLTEESVRKYGQTWMCFWRCEAPAPPPDAEDDL